MNINTYIMNPNFESGIQVDHIDHDTLNNCKANLRCTNYVNNATHRSGVNCNNKSGYRNVFWSNADQRWLVNLQINKKAKTLGRFTEVHEAGRFAEEMRLRYYGDFAGNS